MSRFTIDLVPPTSDLIQFRPDETIKAESYKSLPSIDIGEFLESITKFTRSLNEEDYASYIKAKLAAKTTKCNKDSVHIWNMLITFYVESIKKTYPDDIEIIKLIEKHIKDIDISLLKKESVDNRIFSVYLIGLLEGLL